MKSIIFIVLLAGGCDVAVGLERVYFFNSTLLEWKNAQSYCREKYKDLATVTSVEENKRLLQSGSGPAGSWTGLYRASRTWMWSDGEPLSFPSWFSNVSFSSTSAYGCAVTSVTSGFTENYNCLIKRSFYCYRYQMIVNETKTWEEAQQYCRTRNTGLASVTSDSSLQQLKLNLQAVGTESVWTGLRFIDGKWLWVSGEPLGSLVSMPSCVAPSYRCGALDTTTNALKNQNCNDMLSFMCR